jgi:3-deoxy-D-manno-octulosonic-acid transferase
LARQLYSLLLWILLPAILVRLLWRSIRNPKYRRRWGERFGQITCDEYGYDIWLHAVSMGETNAATPLVHELLQRHPDLRILITTMTPTGSDRVFSTFGDTVSHSYVPYDYSFAVQRFLNRVQPGVLVLIETEIWPNTIHLCSVRNVPVVMLNVRLSEKSRLNYQRIAWLLRPTLRRIEKFGVQSEKHRQRLINLGVQPSNVYRTGSMKFETKLAAGVREVAEAVRQDWGRDRLVIVAGSTHEGEEEILLRIFRQLKSAHSELLLVIAPRHPERFDTVFRLAARSDLVALRRTEQQGTLPNTVDILVADTLGELPVLYSAADIAFVGGSLIRGMGGHNILEPCAVGVPAVFGSVMPNFEEISHITTASRAGIQARDPRDLEVQLSMLLSNPNLRASMGERGISMVAENSGATEQSLQILLPLIDQRIRY